MYTLYFKSTCPFSAKVIQVIEDFDIAVDKKDVADEGVIEELITVGGKKQVPCLVDGTTEKVIYESDDIVLYLMENVLRDGVNDGE